MYKGIIGSLLFLTSIRADIVFSFGMCVRFQACPKESHLKSAKRILRYLKGTRDLVMYYPLGDSFDLAGYVDTDNTGYLMDRKKTFKMDHFLGSKSLGEEKSRTRWLYPQLKLSMLLLLLVVLIFCGSSNSLRIFPQPQTLFPCSVTRLVLSTQKDILFSIREPSTLV